MLEKTLSSNRDTMKRFAVLFFNIESHWWRERYVESSPENVKQLMAYAHTLSLEGATDLAGALSEAAAPAWHKARKQPGRDFFLLSDGSATWGRQHPQELTSAIGDAGTLFAYNTSMAGTELRTLSQLVQRTGGAIFSVTGESEIETAAVAHRKRPWQLSKVTVAGGSDVMVAGRPETVWSGETFRSAPEDAADRATSKSPASIFLTTSVNTTHLLPRPASNCVAMAELRRR